MNEPLTQEELKELKLQIDYKTLGSEHVYKIAEKLYESTKTMKAKIKELEEKHERFIKAVSSHNLTSTLMEG
jgi:hypothetical protein